MIASRSSPCTRSRLLTKNRSSWFSSKNSVSSSAPWWGGRIVIEFLLLLLSAVGDEERGRRELLVVPRNHQLAAPQDRGDRVGRRDLRRLVEDDHIEADLRRQELADHQRAHRPAGLER